MSTSRRPITVVVVALVLLALTLWSTYSVIANAASEFLITTLAALVLPSILLATILAGGAAGILAVGLLPWRPLLAGLAGGLVVGLLAMAGTLVAYHHGPAVPYVAAVVAVTGALGGATAAFRPLAAGIAGGVAATGLGLVVAYFQNDLVDLFGNQETVGTMAEAASRLQLTTSVVSGVLAGAVAFAYLRRTGLALPWPVYPAAGAAAGALTLVSTLLGWLGRLPLTEIVEDYSEFDAQIIYSRLPEQINHGMIVLFAGAFVAMILVGRTIRRA
ncbi:hypothetical protein GCM10010532_023290 [Dactylosporangium siamense]|uniref:Uncharacterized protein n=1 Tax=Dactylosporangium siamense TaxID=685454 RepID=A0A919U6J5_9ACTN|nr:hypothetical protein Dsi01nite_015680 [Dactylosporangium siamense]